jgi:alkylation response protein AidB-like acyl-CoA dehydrogenase
MAAKGWFGITIPAEHGGMGLGVFEYCLVSEELARAWLSVGSILARGQGLGTQTIDDARRLALLRRSAKGKWIGAIALSEPTAGSDLAAVQTRAIRQDGYWLLSGTKRWAGFALAADFIEVLARTRDPVQGEPRSAGLGTFLVVKQPGLFPDGMTGRVIDKIGYHGFLTSHLELDRVRVPENDRLTGLYGDEGADAESGGFAAVQRGLNIARVHTGHAPSASPGQPSRTRGHICRSASSSAIRSVNFRLCALRWPTWPLRLPKPEPSGSRLRICWMRASQRKASPRK